MTYVVRNQYHILRRQADTRHPAQEYVSFRSFTLNSSPSKHDSACCVVGKASKGVE